MQVLAMPPNEVLHIGSLWAYLGRDANGNEGLCAAPIGPDGMCLPLIAADPERLKSITPIAEAMAKLTGMKIVLVEFTTRVNVREITGPAQG
jgi:hypothetical protein